jgi:DNA-binding NarL/FixJ family response regulator
VSETSSAKPQELSVAVRSSDPISAAGASRILARAPDMSVVDSACAATADVVVAIEHVAGDSLLCWLRGLQQPGARAEGPRCVLVTDKLRPPDLMAAVGTGVMAVLPRLETTSKVLVDVVRSVGNGAGRLSTALQGELLDQIERMRCEVLEPNGLTVLGLETRERHVLKGLSDGLGTDEIAVLLGCSERTVKTTLYELMARYNLHTRAHAVAYAVRAGVV